MTQPSQPSGQLRILVYSDNPRTREQVKLALGKRVHPDLPELTYLEVATPPMVIRQMDEGGFDLVILDGEATPAGGMGIAKQLKDEIADCPPILVLTGRARTGLYMLAYEVREGENPYEVEIALVDDLKPGDVPVLACNGPTQRIAPWGELLSTAAQARGAAGCITDGLVRDVVQKRMHRQDNVGVVLLEQVGDRVAHPASEHCADGRERRLGVARVVDRAPRHAGALDHR